MAIINQQILLNGHYHLSSSAIFGTENRSFAYGDCITETIHSCAGRLCFFKEHMQNLRDAMKIADMEIPQKFYLETDEFYSEISKMLVKNKIFKGSNVKITVFRTESEKFIPDSNKIEYIVTCNPMNITGIPFEPEGLFIDIYEDYRKSNSPLKNYNTHESTFLRTLAVKQAYKNRLNDALILNQQGNIIASAQYGNVFVIKEDRETSQKIIYSSQTRDGATKDVMKNNILTIAKKIGLIPAENHTLISVPITQEIAEEADEIFFANTETGIHWVKAFKDKRFYHQISEQIAKEINDLYLQTED